MDPAALPSLTDLRAVVPWLTAAVGVSLALLIAQWAWGVVGRVLGPRATPMTTMVVQRAVWWTLVGLASSSALRELGFDLSVLLGAAGIVTVAIGFAAQTAASNLISGLFLLAERPFVVGDAVRVGEVTGEILAVDLLSVKLRTFDNRVVRIPNETLLKSAIETLTSLPIRRIDLELQLGYDLGADALRALLQAAADRTEGALVEPPPLLQFGEFGEGGVRWTASVWADQRELVEVRVRFAEAVRATLAEAGVTFPARAPLEVALARSEAAP